MIPSRAWRAEARPALAPGAGHSNHQWPPRDSCPRPRPWPTPASPRKSPKTPHRHQRQGTTTDRP
eukprot:916169-Lingulodinium_polyedra.AAC.1